MPTIAALRRLSEAYFPAAVWAVTIFLLSSQSTLPGLSVSTADFVFKKSAHMFVYAVLYFLLWRAMHKTTSQTWKHRWLLPIIITLIYASVDEFHQVFVPGRFGTLRDIGYDMLGASIIFLRQYRYI